MRKILCGLAVLLMFAVFTATAQAHPAHKKALADHFGPFLPKHMNDCRACHLPDKPGMKVEEHGDKPHNLFGTRLVDVRRELRKAGKPTDILTRLQAIADEDSDGDGTANLLELLAGRNPGEKEDRPTELEMARAERMLSAFQNRKIYPWKPFEPVKRPALPKVKNTAWVRNPIDAFLAEQHELFGLEPRPPAPRETLLRRVYLDLIGLPPTPEEVQAFLADKSDSAYEKVVERLLNSPQYGERWARHWMDIWRYVDHGDSGLQDGWIGAPHMWRWRDWIIDSLNAGKGYDRMVQEMLGGDELAPEDRDVLTATAFLARNKNRSRDHWLHETVDHTTRALLGITMECARCHDHMYDPIPQVEYYQMRAIFEPLGTRTDPVGKPDKKKKDGVTVAFDERLTTPTYLYIRGVEQQPDKSKTIPPGVPSLLGADNFKVTPISVKGDRQKSTGRRLALAKWITSRDNPLAARVAVNHVWLRHFGQPIVPSVFDYGADGLPPSHPALLDWLAVEFMENQWSLKHLHRLIVASSAYRMSSTPETGNLQFDPENKFLWRMPAKRMEAEVVRDSILSVAGNLDTTMKGPELDPKRGSEIKRRSIYFRYTASNYLRFLEFFDPAAPDDCYQRAQSIVPQQALTLLNSDLALTQARSLARKLDEQAKGDQVRFIKDAFQRVLSRSCTEAEVKVCRDYLTEQTNFFEKNKDRLQGTSNRSELARGAAEPALRARENLVHLLFNHNDFVTIR